MVKTLSLLLSFAGLGLAIKPLQAATAEVFFIAGQSNADGSNSYWNGTPGKGPALTSENMIYAQPYNGVSYNYVHVNPFSASPPLHYLSEIDVPLRPDPWGSMAFELSLGRELDAMFTNDVVILRYTAPGTSLNYDWSPSQNRLYPDMLDWFDDRLLELNADYDAINFRGFFWHQGESDAGVPHSTNYAENFMTMYDGLRTHIGAPTMPAVLGWLNESLSGQNPHLGAVQINGEISGLAASDPTIASTGSLNDIPLYDNLHFSSNGQIELGFRYADAYAANFLPVPEPSCVVSVALSVLLGFQRKRNRV